MTTTSRFEEMHRQDPSLVYPMLVWDTFPKSGASQVLIKSNIADLDQIKLKLTHTNRLILTCKHGSVDLATLDNLKHSSGIFFSQRSDSMNNTIVLLYIEERLLHLRG